MIQAWAFVPIPDVSSGFKIIQKLGEGLCDSVRKKFSRLLNYVEKNYIGVLKENSQTSRVVPRYPNSPMEFIWAGKIGYASNKQ